MTVRKALMIVCPVSQSLIGWNKQSLRLTVRNDHTSRCQIRKELVVPAVAWEQMSGAGVTEAFVHMLSLFRGCRDVPADTPLLRSYLIYFFLFICSRAGGWSRSRKCLWFVYFLCTHVRLMDQQQLWRVKQKLKSVRAVLRLMDSSSHEWKLNIVSVP